MREIEKSVAIIMREVKRDCGLGEVNKCRGWVGRSQ